MQLKQKYQQCKNARLPAVSLVETIIAMVIVTVAFAGGMILFLNIIRNEKLPLRTEASIYLQNLMVETKRGHLFLDETFEGEGFLVTKSIKNYGSNGETFQLQLLAKDHQGIVIHELNEVIYLPIKKD